MYLKKTNGPRTAKLEDGTIITQADLPAKDTKRWVASRKAAVVRAVDTGLITRDAALKRWDLTEEEFAAWSRAIKNHGESALKITKTKKYRQL